MMAQCKACDTELNQEKAGGVEGLCGACAAKRLTCRVCGADFSYRDILGELPVVQCPSCEGRTIEVME